MNDKIESARGYLERLFGNVTREPGFSKELSEEEILRLMDNCEMKWTGRSWRNTRLQQMIHDMETDLDIPHGTLPARFIWGDE